LGTAGATADGGLFMVLGEGGGECCNGWYSFAPLVFSLFVLSHPVATNATKAIKIKKVFIVRAVYVLFVRGIH
jgi:hypothetical protein